MFRLGLGRSSFVSLSQSVKLLTRDANSLMLLALMPRERNILVRSARRMPVEGTFSRISAGVGSGEGVVGEARVGRVVSIRESMRYLGMVRGQMGNAG